MQSFRDRQHCSNAHPSDQPHRKHLPASHPGPRTSFLISGDFKASPPCDSVLKQAVFNLLPHLLKYILPRNIPGTEQRSPGLHQSAQLATAHPSVGEQGPHGQRESEHPELQLSRDPPAMYSPIHNMVQHCLLMDKSEKCCTRTGSCQPMRALLVITATR